MDKFKNTADRLLGINDEWTIEDIGEHLAWLINNPDEIADGYDESVLKPKYYPKIMDWVAKLKS